MDEEDVAYTMQYYSATRKNEILPFAMMWTECVMLTEISHSEKDKHHKISLKCGVQEAKRMKTVGEKREANQEIDS